MICVHQRLKRVAPSRCAGSRTKRGGRRRRGWRGGARQQPFSMCLGTTNPPTKPIVYMKTTEEEGVGRYPVEQDRGAGQGRGAGAHCRGVSGGGHRSFPPFEASWPSFAALSSRIGRLPNAVVWPCQYPPFAYVPAALYFSRRTGRQFTTATPPSTLHAGGHDASRHRSSHQRRRLVLLAGQVSAKDLRVGTCTRDITPVSPGLAAAYDGGVRSAGGREPHRSGLDGRASATAATPLGYHDRLWARGIVIDGKGGRIAIVTLDVVGYFANEIATIRAMIVARLGDRLRRRHEHASARGPGHARSLGPGRADDRHRLRVPRLRERRGRRLHRRRGGESRRRPASASRPRQPRLEPRHRSGGRRLRRRRRQGARRRRGARARDRRPHRRPDARADAVHDSRRARTPCIATLANFASHPESLGSDQPADHGRLPARGARAARGRVRRARDLGERRPRRAAGSARHRRPRSRSPATPAPRRTFRFAEVHGTQLAERAIPALNAAGHGTPSPRIAFASTNPGRDSARQSLLPALRRDRRARRRGARCTPTAWPILRSASRSRRPST